MHAHDYASALVHSAAWALSLGSRAAVLAARSEPLPSTLSSDAQVAALGSLGAATSKDEVRAAVFNAADDGETTQKDIAKLIAEVIGVKSGFHGSVISSFAKLNIGEVVEDVNDKVRCPCPLSAHRLLISRCAQHLEGWSDLLQASNPPILTNMPISPAVPADLLGPHPISFDSGALKRLTGWKPRYRLTGDVLRETVEGFRREGNWPNARPKCAQPQASFRRRADAVDDTGARSEGSAPGCRRRSYPTRNHAPR